MAQVRMWRCNTVSKQTPQNKSAPKGALFYERELPPSRHQSASTSLPRRRNAAPRQSGALPPIGAASGIKGQSCALAFRLRPLRLPITIVGARYCALMGYIQGWGRKRGTTNALHPAAQSAPHGALFYGTWTGARAVRQWRKNRWQRRMLRAGGGLLKHEKRHFITFISSFEQTGTGAYWQRARKPCSGEPR